MLRKKLTLFVLGMACVMGCRDEKIETFRIPKEAPVAGMAMPGAMGMPDGMGGGTMEMPPAVTPRDISWKVPADWKEQPAASMRVGSFLVQGSNGQSADVSVIPLSGEAGGDLANINRWRGQINLPPIQENELPDVVKPMTLGGRRLRLVELISREKLIDNKFKKRILAVILVENGQTWFFKMTGEDATVRHARPAFLKFLSSLHFHSHEAD